jgi:hypothetical protein
VRAVPKLESKPNTEVEEEEEGAEEGAEGGGASSPPEATWFSRGGARRPPLVPAERGVRPAPPVLPAILTLIFTPSCSLKFVLLLAGCEKGSSRAAWFSRSHSLRGEERRRKKRGN